MAGDGSLEMTHDLRDSLNPWHSIHVSVTVCVSIISFQSRYSQSCRESSAEYRSNIKVHGYPDIKYRINEPGIKFHPFRRVIKSKVVNAEQMPRLHSKYFICQWKRTWDLQCVSMTEPAIVNISLVIIKPHWSMIDVTQRMTRFTHDPVWPCDPV